MHNGAMAEAAVSVVPANEANCEDLQTIFGTRGAAATCHCQRYKLRNNRVPWADRDEDNRGQPPHLRRVVMRIDF